MARGKQQWALPVSAKMTPVQYIKEAMKTIHELVPFEKLYEYPPFAQYVETLIKRYSDLIGISTNTENPKDLRDECSIRASEVEYLVLEIKAAADLGNELRDPNSVKGYRLRQQYKAAEEYRKMRRE